MLRSPYFARAAPPKAKGGSRRNSPNQVLTHAARAAAKQLNKPLCGRARRARRALVRATQEQGNGDYNMGAHKPRITLPGCAAPLYVSLRCFNYKAWGPQASITCLTSRSRCARQARQRLATHNQPSLATWSRARGSG